MYKTMDRSRETKYHIHYSEDLAIPGVSEPCLGMMSLGDKDQ